MDRPFSEVVVTDPWRRDVWVWIERQLARAGRRSTGPMDQVRVRPWSTLLTVPTDAGLWWFKANAPASAFEPALQVAVSALAPGLVDPPTAVDTDRGWLLTPDLGPKLSTDDSDAGIDEETWHDLLAAVARTQAVLAGHGPALLATGLPNCSPDRAADRLDRLLSLLTALPDGHPSRIDPDLAHQLAARRGDLTRAAALLDASALPVTWQHGDLHPGNIAGPRGRRRVLDLGDGQWSHAAEVLVVPYGWTAQYSTLDWNRVVSGWCARWGLPPTELPAIWQAVNLTQPVHRAATWYSILQSATVAELLAWGDQPVRQLRRLLP